jgi:GTPase SAR1 family protein
VLKPPNILFTGVKGVGKSTILNLFPGEIVLEIDDNFNEIIQKSIKIDNTKKIGVCILREIDLWELIDRFNSYYNIMTLIDIICLVIDSTERNILESQELLLKLKDNVPDAKYFIIANFQDRKSISWNEDKIEKNLKMKTFGFSAIQDDSEQLINGIIKEILKISFQEIKEESKSIFTREDINSIWSKIEEAILAESKQDFKKAAELFSNASLEIKSLNLDNSDFKTLFYLCKAWQSLELAHENKNIQKFAEAEIFFNQANEHIKDKNQKNLIYANSIFCEILKLCNQFDELDTPDKEEIYYPKIHTLIKRAIEFYNDGGFVQEREWAKNTLNKLKA